MAFIVSASAGKQTISLNGVDWGEYFDIEQPAKVTVNTKDINKQMDFVIVLVIEYLLTT